MTWFEWQMLGHSSLLSSITSLELFSFRGKVPRIPRIPVASVTDADISSHCTACVRSPLFASRPVPSKYPQFLPRLGRFSELPRRVFAPLAKPWLRNRDFLASNRAPARKHRGKTPQFSCVSVVHARSGWKTLASFKIHQSKLFTTR